MGIKRILFMHQASTIGGGSYCLLNILKDIDKSNIQPVACLAEDGPLRIEIEKLGLQVIIFRQMAAIPYNRSLWSIGSVRSYYHVRKSINAFKKLLVENRIDIVYLNNMMIYNYLKPAKECGCKTILHCREHWPLNEHAIQLQWARNMVDNYCDQLIAINHYSAFMFPNKKATIVYDWVDMDSRFGGLSLTDIFREDTKHLKVFLFTGGIYRIKGAYQVIKTFSSFIKDVDCRLLVVGYDNHIPIQNHSLLKQILFKLGYDVNELKCRRLIANDSRIVCLPSTYLLSNIIEQSYCMLSFFTIPHANLALAESLILGTPVIAARTEESEEYSEGALDDCLFRINDIDDFLRTIENFDYSKKKQDILNKKAIIKDKMSKLPNVKRLNQILDNI